MPQYKDDIGLAVSYQPSSYLTYDTFDAAAQARRIKSRLTEDQFEKAFNELNRQIAETEIRHDRRQTRA